MGKKIIIITVICLFLAHFAIAEKPQDIKPSNFVNDYAKILSAEQQAAISAELDQMYKSGLAEFSIVTINSLEGKDIESFSYQVAEGKLGDNEKNNGLLLLISIEDRKYRFEVGRGLEPVLNDAKIGRIGREYIVPNFRNGNYYEGVYSAVRSVKSVIMNQTESEYYLQETVASTPSKLYPFAILFLIFLVFIIIGISSSKKNSKRGNGDYFVAAWALSSLMRGRGGSGGSFGGGGGFGGGSFGGGGSSGRW